MGLSERPIGDESGTDKGTSEVGDKGRVETWRGGVIRSVSTSRSSNRACGFAARLLSAPNHDVPRGLLVRNWWDGFMRIDARILKVRKRHRKAVETLAEKLLFLPALIH